LPQRAKQTAAIDVDLPDGPLHLRYRRRLRLSAPLGGEATFQVVVDGEVLDKASSADSDEDDWVSSSCQPPSRHPTLSGPRQEKVSSKTPLRFAS
jgi:hypothetical protein